MAGFDPDDLLRHRIPKGFFVAKESEPGRSPTSPLDLSLFGGLFSPRSPSPSSPLRFNKWVSHKVGLSCLSDDDEDSFSRDYVVLAPQIKPKPSTPCNELTTIRAHPSWDTVAVDCPRRSSSSPVDIISPSLSAREMALSEDYTCIISHGPNPKTTHMFGDCILDCDPKELEKPQDCQIHSSREAGEKGGSMEITTGSSYNEEDLFHMAMPH